MYKYFVFGLYKRQIKTKDGDEDRSFDKVDC